ncbi:hydroxyacylglutathione hydrolase [Niveibacterium sp. SC-1]|uniref:hydroxyacylglutathione hydrolase n=1 Tax=Niveibacterium sp. SC-1 TaxID=3135646 RepID=UPI00311F740E
MQIVPLSAFSDNYIWALVEGPNCAVVDPGDATPVERFLAERSLTLTAILLTHHHNDHIGGVAELAARHAPAIYAPRDERISLATQRVAEGDTVAVAGFELDLQVIEVPGHTRSHIAFVGPGLLFCGDTLFAGGCGRLFEGTPAQMHASLNRLAALPAETLAYCAHEYTLSNLRFAREVEPDNAALVARQIQCEALRATGSPTVPSDIGTERATNPFLRAGERQVQERVERQAGKPLPDALAVFAALREWKNHF